MMNTAKAEEDDPAGDPDPRGTRGHHGAALDQYEAEQAAWNRKVGNVADTIRSNAPSSRPISDAALTHFPWNTCSDL